MVFFLFIDTSSSGHCSFAACLVARFGSTRQCARPRRGVTWYFIYLAQCYPWLAKILDPSQQSGLLYAVARAPFLVRRKGAIIFRSVGSLTVACLVAAGLALPAHGAVVANGSPDEYVIRAQILVQLAAYVKWPEPVRQGKPFVLAVIGNSSFRSALTDYASRHTIHGRPIEIQYWSWPKQARDCDMAFICRSEQDSVGEILAWCAERNILTACDSARLTQNGVMVGVVLVGDRLMIYLNRQAMGERGFRASSQLLGLAKLVGPDGSAK